MKPNPHKIRFFEKRGVIWLDFRDAHGARRRVSSGTTDLAKAQREAVRTMLKAVTPKEAPIEAPSGPVVARTQGPTLQGSFDKATRVHRGWIRSKSPESLRATFRALGLSPNMGTSELTRDKVRDLLARWLKEPGKTPGTKLSPSTINHRLSMLSVLLETEDLPPHGVKHLSTRGNSRSRRITDDEVYAVLRWCREAPHSGAQLFGLLVRAALSTAARQGELLALRWDDVQPGRLVFRDTKNGETRTVPINATLQALLEARRGLGLGPFRELSSDRCTALWDAMRKHLGLDRDPEFVFHSLRHEAVTRMVEGGASAFAVQAVAGHAAVTTTQLYVTRSEAMMKSALSHLSNIPGMAPAPGDGQPDC